MAGKCPKPRSGQEIFRATVFHTPESAFRNAAALAAFADGALCVSDGRILGCGDYSQISHNYPEATTHDLRGGFLFPGFIDTHVHYPQIRLIGGFGYTLLDWLQTVILPEEARLSETAYASALATEFIRALAAHGTTTALVFGSHFAGATRALFHAATGAGLRIFSGLVMSDRHLRPELHTSVETAYLENKSLISEFHGLGRLGYVITPRFALSASEALLEVSGALLKEHPDLRFQTHINENEDEIRAVRGLFPWARDYFEIYERFNLAARRSVFAHNVRPEAAELQRVAASHCSVAHCPASNAALGSGVFPMRRHLDAGIHFALGTDIAAGTGFGMLKEALQAYLQQRVVRDGIALTPAQMLYLATRAGAEALDIADVTGDFQPGKAADMVYIRPPKGSVLAGVIEHAGTLDHQLTALFALAGAESVAKVWVEGEIAFTRLEVDT